MRARAALLEQSRQGVIHAQRRREPERAREVEREVFEVVPVAADRVVALPFEPRPQDRLRGVVASGRDGEGMQEMQPLAAPPTTITA